MRADEADHGPAGDANAHGHADETLPTEPDRRLVPGHAGPRSDETHTRRDDRWRDPQAPLTGGAGHVGEEGDRPAAQRVHLPGMSAVSDGVREGGAIPQNGPET